MSSKDAHAHGASGAHPEPHLPHGSVWPFWLALAISAVAIGLFMGPVVFALGAIALVVVLLGWWRQDYIWWKTNTGTGPGMARAGTLLFISSEVFIFGALFSTYFTFQRLASHWPDAEVHFPIPTVAFFTLVLFSSSYTIHQAEKHLKMGNKKGFNTWWGITVLLGAVFLAGQVSEYMTLISEGHVLGSSQFMTTFYMLTGTHGLHVFGGLVYLIVVWIRSLKGQYDEHRHAGPETAAMYWHFVDLVWVVVFSVLYLIPAYVLH